MEFRYDELYSDRTWFDELGARLIQQATRCLPRNPAELWSCGFALFSALCVAWSAGLATQCVLFELPANQCLAQLIAVGLLLVAARQFLRATGLSAKGALPAGARIERSAVRRAESAMCGCAKRSGRRASKPVSGAAPRAPATDAQRFFREVKAAGINVRIARTLYSAGFREAAQVRACEDARLLAIPGVGKATLRKLRVAFGIPPSAQGHSSAA